jgi:hypothetical protein
MLRWQMIDQLVAEPLVVSFAMVVRHELGEVRRRWRSPIGIMRSRHSSLVERTNRSACALQFGARNGVGIIRTPAEARTRSTAAFHFRSRSQINSFPGEHTVNIVGQLAHRLDDERLIRLWR